MKQAILFLFILTAFGCTKKSLELELIESKCKKFKIYSPTYQWQEDPSCGGSTTTGILKIKFKHEGEKDCIHLIDLSPDFYNTNNNKISNVNFSKQLFKSEPEVEVYDDSVTFIFRFTFASNADADALNHIYLKFNTENELGNESKTTEVRINAGCSSVHSSSYTVTQTVEVYNETVKVTLWDDAAEDGDIVSIYLNGVWVLENIQLLNQPQNFYLKINPGDNHLILFAVNEGDVGPNTVAMKINDGSDLTISPDLLKGQAVNLTWQ